MIKWVIYEPVAFGVGGGKRRDTRTGVRLTALKLGKGADNTDSYRIRNRR